MNSLPDWQIVFLSLCFLRAVDSYLAFFDRSVRQHVVAEIKYRLSKNNEGAQ